MKLVTLTRDMRPYSAGADVLLSPADADRLIADGAAANPRDRFGNPLPGRSPAQRYLNKRTTTAAPAGGLS